uniref:Reverse transcriptase domain-containing protein n=1 Tax=Mesocestoides corti TaxID=53468 RepID=A0A5K3FWV3_MESCO
HKQNTRALVRGRVEQHNRLHLPLTSQNNTSGAVHQSPPRWLYRSLYSICPNAYVFGWLHIIHANHSKAERLAETNVVKYVRALIRDFTTLPPPQGGSCPQLLAWFPTQLMIDKISISTHHATLHVAG